ncbi:apolipoprotein N-acyltransferase [Brachyspira hyodysenteriae]|uniref:Apolipoprotein N-acyltransferase n=2 Tax=Brachyspira hyodysenteriae TaxID=159 RepID=A0A3B6VL35_BRAHW|nr:apolipoprotein N-acyltransferase [Brachyspira hyodysenteriae]ACN84626.1 apolipoprotein N-acyltransferase [Brachyspira hyodysenteriae WA1]ANN63299.1 apolipoprotein N-acyltransferase [Brachyspira hyodysenteriae ATCC 27164]AUJ50361.1 apolipoprotein N-acyltransferase [Brachyspira hyodysenteriae]KLI13887.1 acyltransferase [Brachyspira hyodysenteriae]KLI14567.1 acyltransferase [Brachyspira hyodysenteriae]
MSKSNSYVIGVIILSIISAILLFLAFPPLNLFPMSFVALVPLNIIIFKADKIRYYVISSSIFVFVFFGMLLMWIVAFMLRELGSLISFFTLFTILFLLIFLFYFPAMLLSGFLSKKNPEFRFIIVPVVFTFMEYMRNVGFLGFPWGIIGYSQWNFSIFIQSADIFGVLGISFFVYFSNSIIAHYLLLYAEKDKIKYKKPYIPAVVFVSSFVLVIIYGAIKMNLEESRRSFQPKTNIALIQHAFDPNNLWNSIYTGEPFRKGTGGIQGFAERFLLKSDKFQNEEKPDGSTQNGTVAIKRICSLARDASLSKPSLIVYPETAAIEGYSFIVNDYKDIFDTGIPDYAYPGIYNMYIFYDMIKYTQTYHLLGTVSIKENTNENAYNQYSYYNSIEFVNDRGNKIDEYSKIKLVPGGESYPFQDNEFLLNTFPFKNIINYMYKQFDSAGANRWERGKKITVFNHPNGYRISGAICYESAFGDFMRKFAYDGAQALAVITEDSWSYSDESLLQHFYMSVFRAIENRRDLVHNGNSGVTGHISSTGKIISTLPFWKPDYLIANVALNERITIYTRFGEWFVYLCLISIIVFLLSATTKTLVELKEIIKKRFFAKKLETAEVSAAVVPSAKKVDEYINNDNSNDLPSLDDLDDLINKKEANTNSVKEVKDNREIKEIKENREHFNKKLDENKKINIKDHDTKKLDDNKKIDLFSDNTINYSQEMSDIINNSESYSIFEKDKYTSEISSSLSKIIEENEESLNNKDIKKNNNLIKGD